MSEMIPEWQLTNNRVATDKNTFVHPQRYPKQHEMPGQHADETPCSDHPDAPHGFNRNASHEVGHYVCECEFFDEMMRDDIIEGLQHLQEKLQILFGTDNEYYADEISYMKGLK